MIFLKLIEDAPIRIGADQTKRSIVFSGLGSPLKLSGDRLAYLTTALRSQWAMLRRFPGAAGMQRVAVRAMDGMRENLSFYGKEEGVDEKPEPIPYGRDDLVKSYSSLRTKKTKSARSLTYAAASNI